MLSRTLVPLVLLTGSALANYGTQQCKSGFNANGACLWAADYCKDDCSSFLQATVTLCPSTYTSTATKTVTQTPTTVTVSTSTTQTNTITGTVTSTSTSYIDETSTLFQTTTIATTEDIQDVISVTVTATATTTTTTDIVFSPSPITTTTTIIATATLRRKKARRSDPDVSLSQPKADDPQPRALKDNKQKASTCTAMTAYPTRPPWYAFGCHGSSQYSSACSCIGVKTRTTTVSGSVTTVTTTTTKNVTPTVTATATITSYGTATATTVSLTTEVMTTTIATVTVPETASTTVTVTITTLIPVTNTVTPPVVTVTVTDATAVTSTVMATCSAFNFVAVGGVYSGQTLTADSPTIYTYGLGLVYFPGNDNPGPSGGAFDLLPSGEVLSRNTYVLATYGPGINDIYAVESTPGAPYANIICGVNTAQAGLVTGAIGVLSCTLYGNAIDFCTSDPVNGIPGRNRLSQAYAGQTGAACDAIQLAAIPAC